MSFGHRKERAPFTTLTEWSCLTSAIPPIQSQLSLGADFRSNYSFTSCFQSSFAPPGGEVLVWCPVPSVSLCFIIVGNGFLLPP